MRRRRGENGETLVETLVSTALLGIVGIGIIGAIAAVLISTDVDRHVSRGETVLRSYVAAVQSAPYQACAGLASYPDDYTEPDGFTVGVTKIDFWNGAGPTAVPGSGTLTFTGGCGGTDHGLQRISVRVTSPGQRGTTETATFVKRGPVPAPS